MLAVSSSAPPSQTTCRKQVDNPLDPNATAALSFRRRTKQQIHIEVSVAKDDGRHLKNILERKMIVSVHGRDIEVRMALPTC